MCPASHHPGNRPQKQPVAGGRARRSRIVLLVDLVVVLAASVGAALTSPELRAVPRFVTIDRTTTDGTVTLEHTGGPAIDVRRLDVIVTVDGTRPTYQPPVPFFSARCFYSGPRGPFNSASDPAWTTGKIASFTVAGSNEPMLREESEVVVELLIDDQPVATVTIDVVPG